MATIQPALEIDDHTRDCELSYDRVAAEYVARIFDELQHKPLDRALLDHLAERVWGRGPVCDLGCGPSASISRPIWSNRLDD